MKKGYLFLFLLLLIGPIEGYAQMKKAPPKPEVMPSFPGGVEAMYKYINTHIKYPVEARKNGIQGTVAVEFMVDEKGVLSDFLVTKGIGGGCDEESVRVISSMNTAHRWTPAKTNGQPVKAMFTLPIKFGLQ
jgi:periplasmic protein TonB